MSTTVLALHAETVDARDEEDGLDEYYGQDVAIFLGEHEVARIKGRNLMYRHGDIQVEESVAIWLEEKLR